MHPPFASADPQRIALLVDGYPLAWIVTKRFNATMLPLLLEAGKDRVITSLLGHCGRRNLIVDDLRADPNALILFKGPSGYIAPDLVSNADWGPTWNYAAVRFDVEIEFVADETPQAIEKLLDHMEGPSLNRWSSAELGPRYEAMLAQIIAFRAHVREIRPTFKLGQDEARSTFGEIVGNLADRDLARWMEAQAEK